MKTIMKKYLYTILFAASISLGGCADLDLNPPADASTETWYSNLEEFEFACNDLYRGDLWHWEYNRLWHTDRWTDDWDQQGHGYEWSTGALMPTTSYVKATWLRTYKGITRCNAVIANVEKQRGKLSDKNLDKFEGEARFFRACFYSYLIFLYGDCPYYTDYITIDQAYAMGRIPKEEILKHIYEDFDKAAELLPDKNEGNIRVLSATALAFKARTATWMLDYPTAAAAAKACMDSKKYTLDKNFESMFLLKTHTSDEFIFTIPRSRELKDDKISYSSFLPRNNKGKSLAVPSLELFSAFLCDDGLPIDKSPKFDPKNPFSNRDPRLGYTTVEFGTTFLGIEWDPSKNKVQNYTTGKSINNNDSQLVQNLASWTGLILKKGIDEDILVDLKGDPDCIVMRYADVLLMYAEAKIEMNEIDQTVLDAINDVRSRAYKATRNETSKYPAVTETNQYKLRFILRSERRMEFAWENRRWFDLVRWRLCDIAINRPVIDLPAKAQLQKNIKNGDYFFPADALPVIEETGLVNLQPLVDSKAKFRKTMERKFDPAKGYLLPLPIEDVMLIPGMTQNPGY